MIDFPVQVSDKPKGIAVGAAKECVHTLSRAILRSENLQSAKNDDAGTVRERARERAAQSDRSVIRWQCDDETYSGVTKPPAVF